MGQRCNPTRQTFLRRMIDSTRGKLSPHDVISITDGMRKDLALWLQFFRTHNGRTFFISEQKILSSDLQLYTDSSKFACGGFLASRWFQVQFHDEWKAKDIAFLELYAIVVAIHVFGHKLANHRTVMNTDNMAIVHVLNCQTSRDPQIMMLVRHLVLLLLHSILG